MEEGKANFMQQSMKFHKFAIILRSLRVKLTQYES
jgi:hypothetical protein